MAEENELYSLMRQSAERYSGKIAVFCNDQQITYDQLNSKSTLISEALKNIFIEKGKRVAICAPKSIDYVCSVFGILKTNAAYIPVDFFSPAERKKFIIDDCDVTALILVKGTEDDFSESFHFISELMGDLLLFKRNEENQKLSVPDLAYILYTSGSTGVPKGVMHSTQAAMEFIDWCSGSFQPLASDVFSSHAPFHFDLSIFDLFVSLKHGASIVLISEEHGKQPLQLAKIISESAITIWYSTPTVLNLLTEYGKMEKYDFSKVRLILFAGEVFPVSRFKRFKEKIPQAEYYNLYGPTETNVCTWFHVPTEISEVIPIGKVCSHYKHKIMNGELLISGPGMMLGYWNIPAATTFLKDDDRYWYKTGDIVELNENSDFIFKGRRDRMVKRNGFRIELDEIEAALSKNVFISYSAAISIVDSNNEVKIIAFISSEDEAMNSVIKMKEYCINHLPSYMIPNDFIFIKSWPLTSSNKVDYQKLKQLI